MAKKGAIGNPRARIDVKNATYIAVQSALVIVPVLYVPQIPAIVWA